MVRIQRLSVPIASGAFFLFLAGFVSIRQAVLFVVGIGLGACLA
ncbi:MAG: YeeE/YedE family protein, partial [Betaproteobacteria bacterium]|nr:YeeE/YedE family protein [Betaproteobacteria bacterium]